MMTVVWLVLLCRVNADADEGGKTLVVGSYNIRYDNPKDAANGNGWGQRAPVIASLIRFHEFDVLGVQEAFVNQLKDLQALLPEHAYAGCGRDDGKEGGEHAAIFFRKDLFKQVDGGNFWLSPTPEKPSIGWDAKFSRICTWVKLQEVNTGKVMFFFNTHFDHHGKTARLESVKLILKRIGEIAGGEPVILSGDFNMDQESEGYRLMQEAGLLRDSYVDAAQRYALNGTASGFDMNTHTEKRIDHVFHTHGFKVRRYGVLTDSYRMPVEGAVERGSSAFPSEMKFRNYEAKVPSDHFPVLIELEARVGEERKVAERKTKGGS